MIFDSWCLVSGVCCVVACLLYSIHPPLTSTSTCRRYRRIEQAPQPLLHHPPFLSDLTFTQVFLLAVSFLHHEIVVQMFGLYLDNFIIMYDKSTTTFGFLTEAGSRERGLQGAGQGVAGRPRVLLVRVEEVRPASLQGHLAAGHDILVHLGGPGSGVPPPGTPSPHQKVGSATRGSASGARRWTGAGARKENGGGGGGSCRMK